MQLCLFNICNLRGTWEYKYDHCGVLLTFDKTLEKAGVVTTECISTQHHHPVKWGRKIYETCTVRTLATTPCQFNCMFLSNTANRWTITVISLWILVSVVSHGTLWYNLISELEFFHRAVIITGYVVFKLITDPLFGWNLSLFCSCKFQVEIIICFRVVASILMIDIILSKILHRCHDRNACICTIILCLSSCYFRYRSLW